MLQLWQQRCSWSLIDPARNNLCWTVSVQLINIPLHITYKALSVAAVTYSEGLLNDIIFSYQYMEGLRFYDCEFLCWTELPNDEPKEISLKVKVRVEKSQEGKTMTSKCSILKPVKVPLSGLCPFSSTQPCGLRGCWFPPHGFFTNVSFGLGGKTWMDLGVN